MAPLAVFRISFGLLMLISLIRFAALGWIYELYIKPDSFFSYYGFEWIQPLGTYTYLLFLVCGLAALFILIGFRYRISIIIFFLSFTYIELMDKSTYLNHYYFISVLSFLMIFLPAHANYSVDAWKNSSLRSSKVPAWTIDSIKLLLVLVYFYAGLAKLNSDWLFRAMPLQIWLPANYELPLLGSLLQKEWVAYVFSWGGAIYDLSIPFLLLFRKTRKIAFVLVVIFHVLTRILFPIGMFPYIMIVCTLIFFDAAFHKRILAYLSRFLKLPALFSGNSNPRYTFYKSWTEKLSLIVISAFFVIQILFPFRHLLYPGELFWTEQGYRFSWRVMLIEKSGNASFMIRNPETGKLFFADNSQYLSRLQEKQMATQPDFILEYAHFLEDEFKKQKGIDDPEIYVQSFVTLNGRQSRMYINPDVDLTRISPSLKHKTWILPFRDEIKGF